MSYNELHHLNSPLLYGGSTPGHSNTNEAYPGSQTYTPPMSGNPSPSTTTEVPHAGSSAPVTVEAESKQLTGMNSTLISPTPEPLPRGKAGRGKVPGYHPGSPGGLTYDTANSKYKHQQSVYRQELTTNQGTTIPVGSSTQSPAAQLGHVSNTSGMSALESIGQSGSIQDIQQAQAYGGQSVPNLTPDVQQAVNQTVNAGQNLAPVKKKGR
jgi:hypothetical protein